MTMNEDAKIDLIRYTKQTLLVALIILLLGIAGVFIAWFTDMVWLQLGFLGALLGALLASGNLFAIGGAFFVIVVKNGTRGL